MIILDDIISLSEGNFRVENLKIRFYLKAFIWWIIHLATTGWRRFNENSAVIGTIVVGTLLGMTVSRFMIKLNNYVDFEKQGMLIGGAIGLVISIISAICVWKKCRKTPEGNARQNLLMKIALILAALAFVAAILLVECQRM